MRWILHNLWIKLLAVLMAFLLWFHVVTEREYEIDVRYDLVYEGLADSLVLASPPPNDVSVRCRASGKSLLPLLFKERIWHIDLSSYEEGLTEIHPRPQDAPHYDAEEVEFSAIVRQSRIKLHLDHKAEKVVPIVSSFFYQTDNGHVRVGPEVLSPDSVLLSGPASVLKNINRVNLRNSTFADLTGPVDEDVELEPVTGYHVSRNIDKCHIFADVQPYAEKSFTGKPVFTSWRSDGDKLIIEPDSVSVLIGGGRDALSILDSTEVAVHLDTTVIDTVPTRLGLVVEIPRGFRTVSVEPDSVLVRFR